MSNASELRIDVLDSFSHLQSAIAELGQAMLADEGLPAWMDSQDEMLQHSRTNDSHRAHAIAAINQLEYVPSQQPREIIVTPGFIGASEHTLVLAKQVNTAKDKFKQSVLKLRQAKLSLKDFESCEKTRQHVRQKHLSQALQKMGLSKLHLKQCYRKMPILSHAPIKISWTWAHTRSIKRVNTTQARTMLERKARDEGINFQLQKLASLPEQEMLAIVQELAPHLRANIVFSKDCGIKPRLMVKGPMPIFFPADLSTQTPQFKPPKEKVQKDENRLIRNDVRLDPNPFLPAIRAHRYLSEEQ